MSIKVSNLIWEHAPYREGALLVLLAMADWANDDGTRIFPKIETLAMKSRLSERATQSTLRRLEKDGVIACVRRAGGRPGQASEYRIVMERVLELHPSCDPDSSCQGVQELHPSTGEVGDKTGEVGDRDGCSSKHETGEVGDTYIDNRQEEPLYNRYRAREGALPDGRALAPQGPFQPGPPSGPPGQWRESAMKALGDAIWQAWFEGSELALESDGAVAIRAKSKFRADWIANHYSQRLARLFGLEVRVSAKPETSAP